jgi:hypothetical protein
MSNEFEYYLIDQKGDKAYPSINPSMDSEHTNEYIGDDSSPYHGKEISKPKIMEFVFGSPIPRKPVIGDYFSEPGSVISKKIADVLLSMKIKGIQLIPATVMSNKGELYKNLFYIHIYHQIEAMDKEESDYKESSSGSGVYFIDSFRLDENVLKNIPLEDRLIFTLKEDETIMLYHRSVVDAIMATNPEGVQFIKVEDWEF